MATNKERSDTTRASIIAAARECFSSEGYDQTHTDSILERAGISRGALYHHFRSKKEVFEAVYVSVVNETVNHAIQTHTQTESPLEELLAACSAWLSFVRRPEVAVILLELGPQVLGWKKAREIEGAASLAPMRRSLERASRAGEINVPSVKITSLLVNALLGEAALISAYGKPKASLTTLEDSIRRFLEGLRAG